LPDAGWDASGKYLYFLASTDYGLNVGWLDLSSIQRPVTRSLYAIVLAKDGPAPLGLESDEETPKKPEAEEAKVDKEKEKGKGEDGKDGKEKAVSVKIDFEGLRNRIVALPVKARDYRQLAGGGEGIPLSRRSPPGEMHLVLHRWTAKDREAKDSVRHTPISQSRPTERKSSTASAGKHGGTSTPPPRQGGRRKIATEDPADPCRSRGRARQIFREAWRFQRDYFYVRNVHGADLDGLYRTTRPGSRTSGTATTQLRPRHPRRGDVGGHSFVGGGACPGWNRSRSVCSAPTLRSTPPVSNRSNLHRRELESRSQSPPGRAGIDVGEGDYLVAVNGREIESGRNFYSCI
jgi:tricorn protease